MGLDIQIYRMWKPDTSRIWTDVDVDEALKDEPDHEMWNIKPVKGNEDFAIDGADGYLFKCTLRMYDPRKMMRRLGIRKKDGWEEDGACSDAFYTPKGERPDPRTVEWWFRFVNRHHSKNYDDWEHKEIPGLVCDDSLTKREDWWCIVTVGNELADMRKGANGRFYDEDLWGKNFCPICSKRVLSEHMEKYFDDGPGYYENC